jgi:hypothetical protein
VLVRHGGVYTEFSGWLMATLHCGSSRRSGNSAAAGAGAGTTAHLSHNVVQGPG